MIVSCSCSLKGRTDDLFVHLWVGLGLRSELVLGMVLKLELELVLGETVGVGVGMGSRGWTLELWGLLLSEVGFEVRWVGTARWVGLTGVALAPLSCCNKSKALTRSCWYWVKVNVSWAFDKYMEFKNSRRSSIWKSKWQHNTTTHAHSSSSYIALHQIQYQSQVNERPRSFSPRLRY